MTVNLRKGLFSIQIYEETTENLSTIFLMNLLQITHYKEKEYVEICGHLRYGGKM